MVNTAISNVIFSDIIHTTFIKLCVKFEFDMLNVTNVMNLRRSMGQTGLRLSNNNFYTQVYFIIQVPFDPSFLS